MRALGMKVVALLALLKALDEELSVLGKLGKVFHISYGHASRFDQRFKVRVSWSVCRIHPSIPTPHSRPFSNKQTNRPDPTRPDETNQIRERAWALGGMISSRLSKEAQRVQRDMSSNDGGGDGEPFSAPPSFDDFDRRRFGGNNNGAGQRGWDERGRLRYGDDGMRPPPYNPSAGNNN